MMDLLLESALRSLALGGAVWLGLALLRVRNPRTEMTAWTVVLAVALAMPALMDRLTVTLPAAAPALHAVEQSAPSRPFSATLAELTKVFPPPVRGSNAVPPTEPAADPGPVPATPTTADHRGFVRPGFDWRTLAAAVYLPVAGLMLLRLVTGLWLSWRVARAARPLHEDWTGGTDVRVSDAVATPVMFGSTVLLPATYGGWSEAKRQAVLSHELSHVAHGDFYVLLLAQLHRAVFWFNPLASWQLARMAELAEIIGDDTALEIQDDPLCYAGILLDLAGGRREAPVATIAMARVCTLRKRVERIVAGTAVPARIGWRKRALVAMSLLPAAMISSGAIVLGVPKPSVENVAVTPAVGAPPAAIVAAQPHPLDGYVGYYELGQLRALAVTRAGDRLILQETGRQKFDVTANGDHAFAARDGGASVIFVTNTADRTELELREPGTRARRAVRVEAARAHEIETAFAHRVAAAPDRFRDQLPAEGSKDTVLRAVEEWQRGAPDYDRMSRAVADHVRRHGAELHAMTTTLGAVESVFFRGVGPGGFDIYGIKFVRGLAEFRILAGPDGTTEDMIFRPDGDDTPGEVAACTQEPTFKPTPGAVPIQLWLYNDTGADIRVFAGDGEGRRSHEVAIGNERSVAILTAVGDPWIVTDAAGQCLEVVVAGQSTRHHIVPADAPEQAVRPAPRRTAPIPGSEQALRRYIDALGRRVPDYDGMTPQTAAYARQDLALNEAIVARLGALRALSFRGVTLNNGNDIYIAHFANGSAEWRIGLVKDGRIGRLALGPQY
jgi:hypothetical protein